MYKCTICGKTYKTRTTLTRHTHNHNNDPHHTCDICGVAFARRDILNRHLRQGHVDVDESARSRQRIHTACLSCRAARVKCDGEEPCQCCANAQKTCIYSTDSRRVSKNTQRRSQRSRPSPGNSLDPSVALLSPPLVDDEMDFSLNMDEPGPVYHADQQAETGGMLQPQSLLEDSGMPHVAVDHDYHQSGLNLPVDLDGISWPWLHETLFLQDDPFAGLFDDLPAGGDDTGGIDSRVPDQVGNTVRLDMADVPVDMAAPKSSLTDQVDELVEYATRTASEVISRSARQTYWQLASDRLRPAFLHYDDTGTRYYDHDHIMQQAIIAYYMPKFNRLWPFFSQHCFDPDTLHPVLYLVLVSIGSMYGPDYQKHFGTLLHTRLRRLLAASLFDLEGPEGDMTWLAHARLLTQVQGLYFGQKQGFSYAQVRPSRITQHFG
jgi:hypothetical protein